MITDSIANASIPMPASKDFAKKKRVNRTAKLKQCKLDARREQWLSQVKKKGCKIEEPPQSMHVSNDGKKREIAKLEINSINKPTEESSHHYCDSDSSSNSPSSHISSILGSNVSGTNFTASISSSSSTTSGSCSGSVSGEDDCLDDWEAMADALAASDVKSELKLLVNNQTQVELTNTRAELTEPKVQKAPSSGRAWKPDDLYRPQSLPNLAKQNSFPNLAKQNNFPNFERNYCGGVWDRKSVVSVPTSCPICCEDLDFTDSKFHPCGCGFRLCLFCHKRILEEDGRCPGCRKAYDYELVKGEAAFHLARSFSMITRS